MSAFCTFICTVSLIASYGNLKVSRIFNPLKGKWCPEEDSNLHDLAIAST
jgi:hypothetical protein